jgi:ABC-type multidrug transport system fused ATPase/permease subunit
MKQQPFEKHPVRSIYEERGARFAALLQEAERVSSRISWSRLITLAAAIVCFIAYAAMTPRRPWLLGIAVLTSVLFIVLIFVHDRVIRKISRHQILRDINHQAVARVDRNWSAMTDLGECRADDAYGIGADLDLFGNASLMQLIGSPSTSFGRTTLAEWLLSAASPDEISLRQDAVRELAPDLDFRQQLCLFGGYAGASPDSAERFLRWMEQDGSVKRRWLVIYSRVVPLLFFFLVALQAFGLVFSPWWIALLAVNGALTLFYRGAIHYVFDQLSYLNDQMGGFSELLRLAVSKNYTSEKTRAICSRIAVGALPAHRVMKKFENVLGFAELRGNVIFYLPIQLVTLWDFHLWDVLENWRNKAHSRARDWFLALGELEALCGLASLSYDHGDWAFPVIDPNAPRVFCASALGHPLLHPNECVVNDLEIGAKGALLLVTGSNMSGKSTLLRAIGVNVALAQAGGPVCAQALRMCPARLLTSFRVQDSLSKGVSLFMAELGRLKRVIDVTEEVYREKQRTAIFLLDEILHGTNIAERRIAVRAILKALLSKNAIGAVSSHDLTLAKAEGISEVARCVHFEEQFHKDADGMHMTFDYTLREGVSTSSNALKLLQIVGIPIEHVQVDPAVLNE